MRGSSVFILVLALLTSVFLFLPTVAQAQRAEALHSTVIINQVRGTECCSPGGTNELKQQLEALKAAHLSGGFAVRYDALGDPDFVILLKQAQRGGHEIGAFLEITPSLAKAAGVPYEGPLDQWYEARNAYTIGYQPEDRPKILAAYMAQFKKVFGEYPRFSVGWMMDTSSLKRLHDEYGIELHELTREQWGTDSYSLYGGPMHSPYWPSEQWALIPAAEETAMPLIIRQTIADPVWNYGDTSNSRTSQPNDYALKERGFPYFAHLFNQTHTTEESSLAVLGLENSMPERDQQEYSKQLMFVSEWKKNGPGRSVIKPSEVQKHFRMGKRSQVTLTGGTDEQNSESQAWWITTPQYRARVRREGTTLSLTDLRLYSPELVDPYVSTAAGRIAYWIAPFVLDGSRFLEDDPDIEFLRVTPDNQQERKPTLKVPTRLSIPVKNTVQIRQLDNSVFISEEKTRIAEFLPGEIRLKDTTEQHLNNPLLTPFLRNLVWRGEGEKELWGFTSQTEEGWLKLTPFFQASAEEVAREREQRYPFLLPEAKPRPVDAQKTVLYRNNQYAQAGRNPVRLVLFPRDAANFPALTESELLLQAEPELDVMRYEKPHGQNGMIFVDFVNQAPGKFLVTVKLENFSETLPIYFAPNCKKELLWCLTHPQQIPWYVRNWWADRQRAREERER